MSERHITPCILDALADTPVVLLHGARQTGKTTLAQWIAAERHPARYLTLDDPAVLGAALADPAGFVAGLSGPVVLDEVQRAPELFTAIKLSVDRDRRPGRFLMTGSAQVLLVPRLAESLAGRMEVLTLRTLSQGEIEGAREGFLDALYSDRRDDPCAALPAEDLVLESSQLRSRVLSGGYPEVLSRPRPDRRRAWFNAYLTAILQRDVRDLAHIEGLGLLPRLLELLAARASSLLSFAELSRAAGLPQSTLKRYFALLEATFLVHRLPAWSTNLAKRLVRSPKVLLGDTGLLAWLRGAEPAPEAPYDTAWGPVLENFVALELAKQLSWSGSAARLYHYRSHTGQEVDLVLEDGRGRVAAIEVKAAATVTAGDFKGLRNLAQALGDRFHRGVLLYTGREAVSFGPGLHAWPVPSLWRLHAAR